ncbi:hypothetical protein O9K51_10692 [Purpureocillium lavendulum]|uniref:Uncharacterized protein n=1 Tax=Purpureocillium lavendulum TaxID=1247861 RepID=A0AB34FCH6_9HYPO|nr:hypothetical protein O9K51_10692 [Purpureocillium lavendulum]
MACDVQLSLKSDNNGLWYRRRAMIEKFHNEVKPIEAHLINLRAFCETAGDHFNGYPSDDASWVQQSERLA